jgi:hypothetical protein
MDVMIGAISRGSCSTTALSRAGACFGLLTGGVGHSIPSFAKVVLRFEVTAREPCSKVEEKG